MEIIVNPKVETSQNLHLYCAKKKKAETSTEKHVAPFWLLSEKSACHGHGSCGTLKKELSLSKCNHFIYVKKLTKKLKQEP